MEEEKDVPVELEDNSINNPYNHGSDNKTNWKEKVATKAKTAVGFLEGGYKKASNSELAKKVENHKAT